jgi:hypothetical protein
MGGPCPGPCNAQYRKAREAFGEALALYDPLDSAQSRPLPPDTQPWPGDPIWCGRCTARIRQCLSELDEAAAIMLAAADGHRPQSGEQRVAGSREDPTASPAGDDLEELGRMLTAWEDIYRSMKGWSSPPRRGFLASQVTSCASWLMLQLDGILCAPDICADFGTEIMQWHREIAGKGKAGARTLRKPLRCPSCKTLLMYWTEGEEAVQCRNRECGRIMLYAEYEAEVSLRAGQSRDTPAA